jgi:hypothetical protein
MKLRFLASVSSLVLTCALTACGGGETQSEEALLLDGEDPGVGRAAACTDDAAVDYSAALYMGDVGGSVSSTSQASYGDFFCASRYVVEATNTLNKPNLLASANWEDTSLSQANCSSGEVRAYVYGYNSSGAWVQLTRSELVGYGVWTLSPFDPSVGWCEVSVGLSVNSAYYSKVRIAAKALYGTTLKKVSGTISAQY